MGGLDPKYVLEGLLRWIHVVSGIVWIGHLYFFNFVNANFNPTLDAETKKKVVPELMPRALFFFRWGAAFTWVTGILVLMLSYYHGGLLFEGANTWSPMAFAVIAVVFLTFVIYDPISKSVLKNPKAAFWAGWVYATLIAYAGRWAGFSYRGYAIHVGAMFGTLMAANVWMRIWPAQKQIITAVKNGQKPDDALVGIAGLRSKHNTYMSVPLVFMMISKSATWAASPGILSLILLTGFLATYWLYGQSKKVKGF